MRSFALLLASVSLLNVVFHDGIVRHERCAEHGELVDVVTRAQAHADLAHAGLHSSAHSEDEHEHCPLATHTPNVSTSHAVVAAEIASVAAPVERAVHRSIDLVTRDAWRTTPKTGPPSQEA